MREKLSGFRFDDEAAVAAFAFGIGFHIGAVLESKMNDAAFDGRKVGDRNRLAGGNGLGGIVFGHGLKLFFPFGPVVTHFNNNANPFI